MVCGIDVEVFVKGYVDSLRMELLDLIDAVCDHRLSADTALSERIACEINRPRRVFCVYRKVRILAQRCRLSCR
jgi:hypothetical protein